MEVIRKLLTELWPFFDLGILYWLFCGINFTILQNYNIWQLITIGHDYPVPVDKHNSD